MIGGAAGGIAEVARAGQVPEVKCSHPASSAVAIRRAITLMNTLRAVQQPRLIVQGHKQHLPSPYDLALEISNTVLTN
jgi:hypothetical protein